MRRFLIGGVACARLLIACLAQESRAQPVSSQVAKQVAESVVEITSYNCADGQTRTGSGFLFQRADQIVTAYHVVQGCRSFRAFFERAPGAPTMDASIAKVLEDTDLAQLSVGSPPNAPTLQLRQSALDGNEELVAIGYSLDMPTLSNIDVGISIGSSVLKDFLPLDLQQELRAKTQIDINGPVLRLKSFLEPGMSGGPITDSNGLLVGVVAGGLRNGTAPASWGWPGSKILTLLSSANSGGSATVASHALYAMVKESGPREVRQCGALAFTKIGTRSFGDVSQTVDDKAGVQRVAAISTRASSVIDGFMFDVWRHGGSGATVVVPSGVELVADNDRCVAESSSGQFQQIVQGYLTNSQYEVQIATLNFERDLGITYPNFYWQPDVYLMSPGPSTRSDGFVVNRKGAIGISVSSPTSVHAAETLMARGGTTVGVVSINQRYGPQYASCVMNPNSLQCGLVSDELTEFTKFVLATRLSTYPVF